METFFTATLWVAAIGCGLMAGVYFTFSAFVMQAFAAMPTPSAIKAMNSINKVIVSSAFLPLFFGTTIAAVLLIGQTLYTVSLAQEPYSMLGGVIYLIGMFFCTIAFNIPLNNRLAALDPDAAEAEQVWQHYAKVWTRWNHIRTLASVTASLLFTYALSIS